MILEILPMNNGINSHSSSHNSMMSNTSNVHRISTHRRWLMIHSRWYHNSLYNSKNNSRILQELIQEVDQENHLRIIIIIINMIQMLHQVHLLMEIMKMIIMGKELSRRSISSNLREAAYLISQSISLRYKYEF